MLCWPAQAVVAAALLPFAFTSAAPVAQATITAFVAPPGVPHATYSVVASLSSEVVLSGQRTLSGGSTVYDIIEADPTEVIAIEYDGTGKFVQVVDCTREGANETIVECGAVVNGPTTTQLYYFNGTGSSYNITATAPSSIPTSLPSSFESSIYSGLDNVVSIATAVSNYITVTALPSWASR
ncbi:hypothetical protein EMMF5_000713 [Cystobasidiomycetes sp. EMM_F5]